MIRFLEREKRENKEVSKIDPKIACEGFEPLGIDKALSADNIRPGVQREVGVGRGEAQQIFFQGCTSPCAGDRPSKHGRVKGTSSCRGCSIAVVEKITQFAGILWEGLEKGGCLVPDGRSRLSASLLSSPQLSPLKLWGTPGNRCSMCA